MQHMSLIKLAYTLKLPVEQKGQRFYVQGYKYYVQWINQEDLAVAVRIIRNNDKDRPEEDYFAGFITQRLKDVKLYLTKE